MIKCPSDTKLSDSLTAPMAWEAFDDIFTKTDWRLRITGLDPLSFGVEYDLAFETCLASAGAWQHRDQAKAWIAHRVLELADHLGKTNVRRMNLQVPSSSDDPYAGSFLSGLERRIQDKVRSDLFAHFDTSVVEWEREALAYASSLGTLHAAEDFSQYVGIDQLVSDDAARKAIRFVFWRTHWHLAGAGNDLELVPDFRFDRARYSRGSIDETARSRSLVARCIESLFEDNARRRLYGGNDLPVTRHSLKTYTDQRFEKEGVWGLIHIALPRDRVIYRLERPDPTDARAIDLVKQQEPRLYKRWDDQVASL